MRHTLILAGALLFIQYEGAPPVPQYGYTGKITPNAFGQGINADEYGRPMQWTNNQGEALPDYQQSQGRREAYDRGTLAPTGQWIYDHRLNE